MANLTKTEGKILQAATLVFLQKGKDGARMQEIAQQAGINQALLHYYFRSKERLYETVLANMIRSFLSNLLQSLPEEKDFRIFLQHFIDNYLDHLARNIDMIRFILWEIERGGEIFANELRNVFAEHGFAGFPFQEKIEAAINNGSIRPVDPVHLFLNIIGMCVYPFVAKPIIEKVFSIPDTTSAQFLKERKEEILKLVWKGLQPETLR